jgi:radical SAM protein with 4Fe4S-binding SPASM domain
LPLKTKSGNSAFYALRQMKAHTRFKETIARRRQALVARIAQLTGQRTPTDAPYFILELTSQCNQNCRYCYNVWKQRPSCCREALDTRAWCDLIAKLQDETGCWHVTFSGGEPLVREDFREILAFCHQRGLKSILITNGQRLDATMLDFCVAHGVQLFELTLLGAKAATHDALTRTPGSWEKTLAAMSRLYKAGVAWCGVFVATRENIAQAHETLEMVIALGAQTVMFNRFNPGGAGAHDLDLMPTVAQVEAALGAVEALAARYAVQAVVSVPIMPCLVHINAYPHLGFGFCPVGRANSYPTIGPDGRVRPCNHSATILGDFRTQTMRDILASRALQDFSSAVPAVCRPCPALETCRAGCRAAAEVCFGSLATPEPWLEMNLDRLPDHPG